MRYLSGRPFTVAVGPKVTAEEWARIFGPKVENAAIDRGRGQVETRTFRKTEVCPVFAAPYGNRRK